MQKWEYHIEKYAGILNMDLLGADGWELVTAFQDKNQIEYWYFKRPTK